MPLYSDSNYYYSGGSSQLYSPYTPSTTSIYSPYTSSYNRSLGGSYVVPVSTPRTAANYTSHLSSRYQPKLNTISETSPMISGARHTSYMPLTRIQSPKCYTSPSYSHSHTSTVNTIKYTPPRPILINTADIDVSANRYRKRKEETLRQAQRESDYTSPTSSLKRTDSFERREKEERNKNDLKPKQDLEVSKDTKPEDRKVIKDKEKDTSATTEEPPRNRSTIKRNRAVVRLSTIRSRSKDRNKPKAEDSSSPEPEKKPRDFSIPAAPAPTEETIKWRQKLADDLASIPSYPNKKSPGDLLREKYLIQDSTDEEDYAAQCRAERQSAGLPKETIEQVMVELDPLHQSIRRLSIPQCPTFHDICEDISSDKIDDDLNAGELRRRASIIQLQEQDLYNQLQKSNSGTFQMITLERRGSHDSNDELPHKRHSKRLSKKGKKLRTKITAIVEVENAPTLAIIPQEEEFDPGKSPKPKFTVSVDSVEEHHEIHKVIKLPKKKSIKRNVMKVKAEDLPDGFMSALPKPQISPKKKVAGKKYTPKNTAELFTFDDEAIKEAQVQELKDESIKSPLKFPSHINEGKETDLAKTPDKSESVEPILSKTPTLTQVHNPVDEESQIEKLIEKPKESLKFPAHINNAKTTNLAKTPKLLKTSQSLEESGKPSLFKMLEKSNSTTEELKSPKTPKETISTLTIISKELETKASPKIISALPELTKEPETKASPKTIATLPETKATPKTISTLTDFKKEPETKSSPKIISTLPELTKEPETKSSPKTISTLPESIREPETKASPKIISTFKKEPETKSSPKAISTLPELTKEPETKPSPKTLKTSQSLDIGSKPNLAKTLEKTNSLNVELKTPPVAKKSLWDDSNKKEEESKTTNLKTLKTSQSLDNDKKTNLVKPLEKSNSITIELKTPTTPTTPSKTPLTSTTIKEESDKQLNLPAEEPKVATPKPIRKAIKKSDSGEDFWAQIGSRETFYMNKRKHELVETQWQKRENLLESTTDEEVKNIEEIKTMVTSQKIEALKKADQEQQNSKGVISRSNSNESAMKKKTPKKSAEEESESQKEEKPKKKISPIKKKKTPTKLEELAKDLTKTSADVMKLNDKLESTKTPEITKISQESSSSAAASTTPSTPNTMANAKSFGTTAITTTTPPKIIGQLAKSPEQQEQAEQNKFLKTNNNKNEIDINKETTATIIKTKAHEQQPKQQQLAKTFTLPKENDKLTTTAKAATTATTTTTSATTTTNVAEATTTKQPETETINKLTADNNKTKNITKPTKTTDKEENKTTEKAIATTKKEQQTEKKSPAKTTKAKTSPNAINADQFVAKAPNKTNTSPIKINTKTTSPKTTANNKTLAKANNATAAAPTKKTPDDNKKKTTNATSTHPTINNNGTTIAATATAATTTTDAVKTTNELRNNIKDTNNNNTTNTNNDDCTRGGNLSKFATVSNLAQCLQDVDADLAEYIPSSAENSENDYDYNTEDSDFDYSSIDGWEKLTPSMKKKVKQRRRKEKQAEQARFDPQKKVKIDTTRKLFVKEEAPRFPLVATPRPLWKREKIIYPDEDSDDESDSEESGSTEETDESDECTTSEEFDDELHPTASNVGSGGGDSGVKISDPNKENPSIIRMSTCSNDSGFEGGTAPSSPKKMLECDVNCHKKCERLTANLCGVNQKLIVEALANVKRGARETRDSPSTPPSLNPAYEIEPNEEQDETSYTYSQFQKSGRFTPPATIIPRFKNYTVDDFHFLAVLGKGSFGKVLLAELRDTTYYYAVKCLKKDVVLEDDDVDSTLIERKVLALGTKHPYLCHLFCTFQTESHLFFVMEYLNGGDLMFHIQESGRFTEERARFYGAEIISGLKFLHKKGIIYRDLKLDNVLLDYEGHVRIADFGMCKLQIYLDKTADSFCGTPDYMAPEIIKGDSYNQNVDWWSFGVLLYEMLIGQSPFSGCDEDELFWSICNELPWFPVYISAEATGILKGLLEKDYMKRIGSQYSPAGDVVEHIFFRPIDWNQLEKRQIEPPFRPQVKHPLDTQYFDRVFTRERVRLTPIDKDILKSMDQNQFLGFTYTNPHITLD